MFTKVAIAGIDHTAEVAEIKKMLSDYNYLEFAILYSHSKMNEDRYPNLNWIANFIKDVNHNQIAIHLCGESVIDFINNSLNIDTSPFSRIQLNFNALRLLKKISIKDLIRKIEGIKNQKIIIQHNKNNESLLDLKEIKDLDIHILYDASGGYGKEINSYLGNIYNKYTGYAGGITPENVIDHLNNIRKVHQGEYYIDLESGVRTDNKFDILKVNNLMQQVEKWKTNI